ncbi:hypothetical protein DRE_01091 [Drechslerella stenobrocha 248]|uniref:Uncharacterized protein n=1 Tax=Drechslerella stenobrocha 248 TaxID=1043628 RepID=W7I680_9PEZI|nr:hypothetical protein DRE_01091 [Drechslerella stenobrocha 248]
MSTFNPAAIEIDYNASVRHKNARRIRKKEISGPSNFVRLSSPDWQNPTSQGLRPLTLVAGSQDFNKKLPSPPTVGSDDGSDDVEESVWRKAQRLWIPLDMWARFIIVLGFCEAVMAWWGGMQIILSDRLSYGGLWTAVTAVLLVWSIFFTAVAYCGSCILWGRWSSSASALRVMRLVATMLTVLYGIAAAFWFYYGFQSATTTREACVTTSIFWDGQTVPAPQPWVDLCLKTASNFERLQVGWGFMNAFQVYFMMLLVQWAGQQERKLRRQKRWSRNSGLAYSESEGDRFDKLAEAEMDARSTGSFDRPETPESVKHVGVDVVYPRQDNYDLEKQPIEDNVKVKVGSGMAIPNFPMPGKNRSRMLTVDAPPTITKSRGSSLRVSAGSDNLRGSGLSGAIPIALDLRGLNSPRFYGKAF